MELSENQKVGLIVGIPVALAAILVGASVATAKPAAPPGPPPTPICAEGDVISQMCADGTQIIEANCISNHWVFTGSECPPPPEPPPPEHNYINIVMSGTAYVRVSYYNHAVQENQSWLIGKWSVRGSLWDMAYRDHQINEIQYFAALLQLDDLGI